MPLQSDVAQIRYNSEGADLMSQSQLLRQQYSDTQSEISTLRPQVKADIANDVYNRTDIQRLMDLLNLRDQVTGQMAAVKSNIQALRAVIANQTYHDELLAEEQLLP